MVSGSELPPGSDNEDPSRVLTTMIKDKKGIVIKHHDISVTHRLGKKSVNQGQDTRSVIVNFCRREINQDLIKACETVKPRNFFINESLIQTRSTELYGLHGAGEEKVPRSDSRVKLYGRLGI